MSRITSCAVLLLGLALAPLGACAEGQLLYWRIDDQNAIEFDYALLYAVDTSKGEGATPIALPNDGLGGVGYESDASRLKTSGGPYELCTELDSLLALEGVNPSAYGFYIELIQWDAANEVEVVYGLSEFATYDYLLANHHILNGGLSIPANLVDWTPATVVPEPSGLCLLLLGLAVLGLRRPGGRAS